MIKYEAQMSFKARKKSNNVQSISKLMFLPCKNYLLRQEYWWRKSLLTKELRLSWRWCSGVPSTQPNTNIVDAVFGRQADLEKSKSRILAKKKGGAMGVA